MLGRIGVVLGVSLFTFSALGDELAAQMRDLIAQHGETVITVRIIIEERITFFGEQETSESIEEIRGTVVSPDGMVVVSLFDTEPSHPYGMFMDEEEMKTESTLKGIVCLLPDGKEIDARIVLRDKALDLAFLRPAKPLDAPVAFLDFAQMPVGDPQPMDRIIELRPMDKVVRRQTTAYESRLQGLMEKPRKWYVVGDYGFSGGVPIFLPAGDLVGLQVVRTLSVAGADPETASVILPARDLAEILNEVPVDGPAAEMAKIPEAALNNTGEMP
jgi:hypothetical protein